MDTRTRELMHSGTGDLPDNVARRFWAKVHKTATCWLWTGARKETGYGLFKFQGTARSAHRMAYILSGKRLLPGVELDHRCENRHCVRPSHLRSTRHAAHMIRHARGRVVCRRGHPITRVSHYLSARGERVCRLCRRVRLREWRERREAA